MAKLISFDIDGTLEVGDPPGIITLDMVRKAKELGFWVGSCSDRTISTQQRMWRDSGISVDFTVLKHQEYYHIGDTDLDRHYSERAGFSFLSLDVGVTPLLDSHSPS